MKEDRTHICVVSGASGSRSTIGNEVKGCFDSFLQKQREVYDDESGF